MRLNLLAAALIAATLIACATTAAHAQATVPRAATAPVTTAQTAVTQAGVPLPTTGFDPAKFDPSVALAISGGRWANGAQRGSFRLMLLRDLGRAPGRLIVQWLEEQPAARRVVVHSSVTADAIPNGPWALGVPQLVLRDRQWYAVVSGTTDAGRIRRTWRFALDAPGKLREVQPR